MKLVSIMLTTILFITLGLSCNTKNATTSKTNITIDVRTAEEWEMDGHAPCTINYPLDKLSSRFEELKKYDSIFVVCRSGNRAAMAKEMLLQEGISQVENKGAWENIECN